METLELKKIIDSTIELLKSIKKYLPEEWLNKQAVYHNSLIYKKIENITNLESINSVILYLRKIRPRTYLFFYKINHYDIECTKNIIKDIKIYKNTIKDIMREVDDIYID